MELVCIGDVAIMDDILPEHQWDPPVGVIPGKEMKVLFNWELPVGKIINPTPRTSGPRLLSHPDSVNVIRKWAPGFAALATNHILDAGEKGLAETISALKQAGFKTVGAGSTVEEITKPLIWETKEGRLTVVNWVFPETHPDWNAVPGPNCWPGVEAAQQIIRDMKDQADWVIIVAHWSDELFPFPRPEDRLIAREMARMGADIIIGHHPHVVRGMEWIGTCPVFYSIGNYYFSDYPDPHGGWVVRQAPRNRESIGILFTFQKGVTTEFRVLSFWNAHAQTKLDPMRRASRRMDQTSQSLNRKSEIKYEQWYASERNYFYRYWARWHFGVRRLGVCGLVQYAMQMLHSYFSKEKSSTKNSF